MNSKPKISVVIPVHNTGELLNDSIGSILQQTLKDVLRSIRKKAVQAQSIPVQRKLRELPAHG